MEKDKENVHDKEWFIKRIGKRVYRDKSTCDCLVCRGVEEHGLIVSDKLHAHYLFDCQCELDLRYYDENPNKTD